MPRKTFTDWWSSHSSVEPVELPVDVSITGTSLMVTGGGGSTSRPSPRLRSPLDYLYPGIPS